jgi:hypothetical protein
MIEPDDQFLMILGASLYWISVLGLFLIWRYQTALKDRLEIKRAMERRVRRAEFDELETEKGAEPESDDSWWRA